MVIIKPWAKKFYKSAAWINCRDAYFVSQDGLCERCSSPGLIVHHKKYLSEKSINDPDISLNWNNLELLCIDCHNKEHFKSKNIKATRDGLMFNDSGELVQAPP